VDPGAKLASPIQILERQTLTPNYASGRFYWRQILSWCAAVIFGLALFLVAPVFFTDVETASNKFGSSLGLGLLALFAIPVAAIVACLTVVGLGVGIATIFLYVIAIYGSQVFIGSWLGAKIMGVGTGAMATLGRLALGLGILHVVRLIPFAGRLVGFVVVLWGLGALALAIHKRLRPQFAPAAA
jgi:hypothetical protein